MTTPRQVARDLTPPLLARWAGRRSSHLTRFEDGFPTWEEAAAASTGYDEATILAQVMSATDEVVAGRAAFERDGVTFPAIEHRWPVAAALLRQAAIDGGTLRVLDFGGSLGSGYRQHRDLLAGIDLRWAVVEQAAYVEAGQRYADDRLSFHADIDAAVAAAPPSVILLSSVLQYLPDPYRVIDRLSATGARTLVIDRTPMTDLDHDVPAVQIVPPSIYTASYPAWLLSRARLVAATPDWHLLAEFDGIEPDATTSHGVAVRWHGMALVRSAG